jgi:hypothetical protein
VPWDRLQWHALGTQRGRGELDEIWQELLRRSPDFYTGHYSRLQVLCGKWQGSDAEVLEFADTAAHAAPPGSPIAAILVAAHLELAISQRTAPAWYFRQPAVQTSLAELSDTWSQHPSTDPRVPEAHHLFGGAFYVSGDWLRARRHLSRVSAESIPRTLPWSYLSPANEGRGYLHARKELKLTPGTGPVMEPGPLPVVPKFSRMPSKARPRGLRWLRQGIGLAVIPISIILIRLALVTGLHDTSSTAEPTRLDLQAPATNAPSAASRERPRELPDIVSGMTYLDSPNKQDLADTFTQLINGGDESVPTVAGAYRDSGGAHSTVIITQSNQPFGSEPTALVATALANAKITDSAAFSTVAWTGTLRCGTSTTIGVVCVRADQPTEIAINFGSSRISTDAHRLPVSWTGTLRCGTSTTIGVVCVWADQFTEIAINFGKSLPISADAHRALQIARALESY